MMGYGPEDKNTVLELTYNYGVTEYDKGNAYAQVVFISLSIILFSMSVIILVMDDLCINVLFLLRSFGVDRNYHFLLL